MEFLRLFYVITIITNVCNILGSVLTIGAELGSFQQSLVISFTYGLGCAFAWFNMLRYFESFKEYYVLVVAFRKGLPGVTRLVVSAFPIILGYTLFGMVTFSELSDNFDSFDHSFAALFSTINGDSLYSRFIAITPASTVHKIVARFYEYSFVCIACYAVVNIFIAIIQEAYTQTKQNPENEKKKVQTSITARIEGSSGTSVEIHSGRDAKLIEELLQIIKETRNDVSSMEKQVANANERLKVLDSILHKHAYI